MLFGNCGKGNDCGKDCLLDMFKMDYVNLFFFGGVGGLDLWLVNVLYSRDYCLICVFNIFFFLLFIKKLMMYVKFVIFCFLNVRKYLVIFNIFFEYCRYFKMLNKMIGWVFFKYFFFKIRKFFLDFLGVFKNYKVWLDFE